jgi:tripartite-type tricarboxylate transporter receptor subunit TctC
MELLKSVAGFEAVHVPFNGSPPAVTATIQGETQAMFAVMQPLQAQVQAGKLRALAVTTAKRFPLLPDLPTIAESGYPGFEALAWNGVMVPAATPKLVIARLNAEMNAILKQPDVIEKMQASGFDLIGGTPEDFGNLIKRETETWTPVIRRLGLKVD